MGLLKDAPVPTGVQPPAGGVRRAPGPRRGGPVALFGFMRANGMLRPGYAMLMLRLGLLKMRFGRRLQIDGPCFICPGVKLEIGRGATLRIGRWAWIGHGCKIRVHEGEVSIGAKTVIGQECTVVGLPTGDDRPRVHPRGPRDADRLRPRRGRGRAPIRLQGIYKRDVEVGHNVWIGYGACILRGVRIGDNSIVGTSAVVTRSFAENTVLAGVPARVLRMREAPRTMRWQ